MKGYQRYYHWLILLFLIGFFMILTGCQESIPNKPVINFFNADTNTINEGDSAILSWNVNDASEVILSPGDLAIDLTGSISVSPSTTTTYTLIANNSAGVTIATLTITVNPMIILQEMTIQPVPEEGKDTYVSSETPTTNFGSNQYLNIGKQSVGTLGLERLIDEYHNFNRSYIQFDLSSLPAGAIIVKADFKLYQYHTSESSDFIISIHRVTEDWEENTMIWTNQPHYPSAESTINVSFGMIGWLSCDITSLVQDWWEGEAANYGIVLKDTNESSGNISYCYSSDNIANPTLRPKLEITYYVP